MRSLLFRINTTKVVFPHKYKDTCDSTIPNRDFKAINKKKMAFFEDLKTNTILRNQHHLPV
jgi:hypothetical protein